MAKHWKRFSAYYLIGIGILLIAVSPYVRGRFDLSEDGKYTLSESSEIVLNSIDSPILVQVYLGGDDLPGGFKRLKKETLDLLADIKSVSSANIDVQLIDVYDEYPTEEARAALTRQLDSLGIPPTNLVHKENGKQVQQLVFPGLVISKGALKTGVLLLKGNKLASPDQIINQSIEGLEYEIVQGIQTLLPQERKKIGFFVEYSSTSAIAQIDLINALKRKYDLFPVDLAASPTLDGLDAICVLNPTREFSESDAYKMDQFIVKGGKALFLVDGVKIDTLENQGLAISPRKTGLENILFHYGLRINVNLVKDAQLSGMIPLKVGNMGNKPNIQLMPWPAFPLLNGNPTTLTDLRQTYCDILDQKFRNFPNLKGILKVNLTHPNFDTEYAHLLGTYDSIVAMNVVEHIENDSLALHNCYKLLAKGGHVIILVPAYQWLYNKFDKGLEHFRRYTKSKLTDIIAKNGFEIIHNQYFNFVGIAGWFVTGSLLKKETIPEGQMGLYNTLVPAIKIIDKVVMNTMGLSTICVGKKN